MAKPLRMLYSVHKNSVMRIFYPIFRYFYFVPMFILLERRLINKQVRQVSDWGKDPFERPDFASDLMSGTTSRKVYKIRKKL